MELVSPCSSSIDDYVQLNMMKYYPLLLGWSMFDCPPLSWLYL